MEFGVCLPNMGNFVSKQAIMKIALEADKLGYHSIWTTDHIIVPKSYRYPFGRTFESLTTLAFVGAILKSIYLGTSAVILPLREQVLFSKQITTLDNLTNGRLILAAGAGWLKQEFNFLNRNYESRFHRFVQNIKFLKEVWSGYEAPTCESKKFENAYFFPSSIQKNGPPLWIAGNSEKMVEIAAELGDGWHPSGISISRFSSGVKKIMHHNPSATISLRSTVAITKKPIRKYKSETGGSRYPIEGLPEQIIKRLELYQKHGLEYLICWFRHSSFNDLLNQLRRFAKEIMPSFNSNKSFCVDQS